jgi:hypothetical protein
LAKKKTTTKKTTKTAKPRATRATKSVANERRDLVYGLIVKGWSRSDILQLIIEASERKAFEAKEEKRYSAALKRWEKLSKEERKGKKEPYRERYESNITYGLPRWDRYSFNIGEDAAAKYWTRANALFENYLDEDRRKLLERSKRQTYELLSESIRAGQLRTALAVRKELNELEKVYDEDANVIPERSAIKLPGGYQIEL